MSNLDAAAGAGAGGAGLASGSPIEIIGSLIGIVLSLLGVVFLILIIWAGFKWMTAQGEAKETEKARDILINAVIGLAIILSAYAISDFVINQTLIPATSTTE